MTTYSVCIIGAGPAGMMSAIQCAETEKTQRILLIEKNKTMGKKLLLTGGGRCNLTNSAPLSKHLKKFQNPNFIKPSLKNFPPRKLLNFFIQEGVEFEEEASGRYIPETEDAHTILNVLEEKIKKLNITLLTNTKVKEIEKTGTIFKIYTNNKILKSENIILALGGKTYPQTGSKGDGYKLSQQLGHNITPLKPGLIPLKTQEEWVKELNGMKLNDIKLTYKTEDSVIEKSGDLLFTHFGFSGPPILDISQYIIHESDNKMLIDLLPRQNYEELRLKLTNDFQEHGKTMIKNYLKYYLTNRFIDPFLNKCEIDKDKQLNQINKKEKNRLINNLKQFPINITGHLPFKMGMVTCGGVDLNEVNPKTMESRITEGLYFAGELLDLSADSGGYNLQMAFSTATLAGQTIARK